MAKPSTSLLKRRLNIAEIVRKQGEIKVDDLAEMLSVSGVTIRNDLNYLENQGYLKRSFGGAIYTAQQTSQIPVTHESSPLCADKMLEVEMARQLAAWVTGEQTLFLGQGSPMRKVIPFIGHHTQLHVLVNDLEHVAFAQEFLNGGVSMLGGAITAGTKVMAGEVAIRTLRQIKPNFALLTIDYLTEDGTLSVNNDAQAQLLAAVLEVVERTVILLPKRPIHSEKRYAVGELCQVAGAITPQIVAAEYYARLQVAGFINNYTNNECLTWANPSLQTAK